MELNYPSLLQTKSYVNGKWASAESGKTFAVINPYNQEVLAQVADLDKVDAIEAIVLAEKALDGWRIKTAGERAKMIRKWGDLMIEHKEDLGKILTLEQGKPLKEAIGEIVYGASFVEWFAEEAKRTYGDVIPSHAADKRIITIKQPIGVVAAITPWNFPNAMISRKAAPALAAGCTFLVKPAKKTPLSALAIAVLAAEAGIPAGVFNVITSSQSSSIGEVFTESKTIRKISFTGSTEIGKVLMKGATENVKKVSMELGGNAPFLVFDDADIDKAVQGVIESKFRNAGQTCVCTNRIFVQSEVHDVFVEKLIAQTGRLKVGDGMVDGVEIGPLIDRRALDAVQDLLNKATEKGAQVCYGGKVLDMDKNLMEPTVLIHVNEKMDIHQEEIFGPIAAVYRFETEEEAIQMANNTPFGLASYFYSKDISRVWRVSEALAYGIVGVNTGLISTAVAPFGGVKESGVGREGSKYGIDEYLEIKYICMGDIV